MKAIHHGTCCMKIIVSNFLCFFFVRERQSLNTTVVVGISIDVLIIVIYISNVKRFFLSTYLEESNNMLTYL